MIFDPIEPEPFQDPGIFPPPEPEIETEVELEPPKPSPETLKEIEDYTKAFGKAGREFMKKKEALHTLLWGLFLNTISMQQWQNWYKLGITDQEDIQKLKDLLDEDAEDEDDWSDYVHSPAHMCNTWVDNAYQIIFGSNEWLYVVPDNPDTPTVEDIQYPTAFKLQQLTLDKLAEGKIHARMYELIQAMVVFGSCYGKLSWYSHEVPRYKWDLELVEEIEDDALVYDCPLLQLIPLDKVIVDTTATHNDIQRWRGIGHIVERQYESVLEGFESGRYNLGKKEFVKAFENGESGSTPEDGKVGLQEDEDKANLEGDKANMIWVWEFHIRVPTKAKGLREYVVTIATRTGKDDPSDGVMIKAQEGTLLDCGLWPFVGSHFTPLPGTLGIGLIEGNRDILFQLSQLIGQFQDNVRASAHCGWLVDIDSPADAELAARGDKISCGMILRKYPNAEDPVKPITMPNFPAAECSQLIKYLSDLLERRMSTPDTYAGFSDREKSATEADILYRQGAAPTQTRVDLMVRNLIGPAGQIALAMIQQFTLENKTIWVRDSQGTDVPVQIQAEEIQSGKYKVYAALTRQDQNRLAKAATLERILPTLVKIKPMIEMEMTNMSLTEIVRQMLVHGGVDNVDRIFTRMTPQEQMMRQMMMQGGPPPGGMPGQPMPNQSPQPPEANAPPLAENGGPGGGGQTDTEMGFQEVQEQQRPQGQPSWSQ